jgi:hypothetical protein
MKNSRWSKENEAMLLQTVQRSSTTRKGIRTAARKLNRTVLSCANRYYMLQRTPQPALKKKALPKSIGYNIPVHGKIKAITFTDKSVNLIFS